MPLRALAPLVLVLLLGLPVAAPASADGSLTMPASHVGDRIIYTAFQRTVGPGKDLEDQPWVPRGGQLFEIVRVGETLDRDGQARPVVVLATNQTRHLLLAIQNPSPGSNVQPVGATTYEYVDLATRDVVRSDLAAGDSLAVAGFEATRPSLRGLDYQGVPLQPSQDLSYETTDKDIPRIDVAFYLGIDIPSLTGDFSFGSLQRWNATFPELMPPGTQMHRWVHQEGTVHGQKAWGIRTEFTVEFPSEARGGFAGANAGGKLEFTQDEWVPASSAYVLQVHGWSRVENGQGNSLERETVVDLARFEPGDGAAVEWKAASCCPPRSLERQATDGLPADGDGPGLAYPAGLAVQDSMKDPYTMAWMVQHPGARVVSARLERGPSSEAFGTDARSLAWTLCWEGQDGARHATQVERRSDLPVATAPQQGRCPDGFAPGTVPPAEPITFAEAARRAALVWPNPEPPDFVLWGEANPSYNLACPTRVDSPPRPEELETRPYQVMVIGWSDGGSCYDMGPRNATAQAILDVETGRPLWGLRSSEGFDRSLPLFSNTAPDLPGASTTFSSSVFPELPTSVLVFGGSVTVAAVVGAILLVLRHLGVFAGYSKVQRHEVLDHPTRDTLMEAIRADPGIHSADLARTVGIAWGTVRHHLRQMSQAGLVTSMRSGRTRSWFVKLEPRDRQAAIALRNPVAARILEQVQASPGVTVQQVANKVDVTSAGVLWHLQRLEAAGLLTRHKSGRTVHLHAVLSNSGRSS